MLAVDIDPEAISTASENVANFEVPVDLLACDVLQLAVKSPQANGDSTVAEIAAGLDSCSCASSTYTTVSMGGNECIPSFIESSFSSKVEYESWVSARRREATQAPPVTSGPNSMARAERRCVGGRGRFDCVLMNPPFGTQSHSNGIDMAFLQVGAPPNIQHYALAGTLIESSFRSSAHLPPCISSHSVSDQAEERSISPSLRLATAAERVGALSPGRRSLLSAQELDARLHRQEGSRMGCTRSGGR